jgi:hypothetical protein
MHLQLSKFLEAMYYLLVFLCFPRRQEVFNPEFTEWARSKARQITMPKRYSTGFRRLTMSGYFFDSQPFHNEFSMYGRQGHQQHQRGFGLRIQAADMLCLYASLRGKAVSDLWFKQLMTHIFPSEVELVVLVCVADDEGRSVRRHQTGTGGTLEAPGTTPIRDIPDVHSVAVHGNKCAQVCKRNTCSPFVWGVCSSARYFPVFESSGMIIDPTDPEPSCFHRKHDTLSFAFLIPPGLEGMKIPTHYGTLQEFPEVAPFAFHPDPNEKK